MDEINEISESEKKKHPKRRLIIFLVLAVLVLPGLDHRLRVREYEIQTEKVSSEVRIALVTDLHSCRYGKNMKRLVDAIDKAEPDMILLGGDIFDDKKGHKNTEIFLREISGRYPIYYVTGNHEYWGGKERFAEEMSILSQYGVQRLQGTRETIQIGNERIVIAGIDDPDSYSVEPQIDFDKQLASVSEPGVDETGKEFSVLLSHRPELYEKYQNHGFDLVLSGHAHGGQWRIPFILNGLYAPNQGLLPKLAGGLYDSADTPMIVSRGLARETTFVPRFYNRPELVIVKISASGN